MKIGFIRIKTLRQLLFLCYRTVENSELPTVYQIMDYIGCCKGNAYNYLRALRHLFSKKELNEEKRRRERELATQTTQQQLTT